MIPLVLYCKSWRQDVRRAKRLAESVARFNRDRLELYVSAPAEDLPLFREQLHGIPHHLICDDDILRANPRLDVQKVQTLRGYLSQQIVKSEFWRLGISENYLCLDSDSYFIRDFGQGDFIAAGGTPYTVMHEGKEFLQYLVNIRKLKIVRHAEDEQRRFREQFPGLESRYRFGPTPVIWSAKAWRQLDEQVLQPRNMTVGDAIERFPSELHWYGGAVLATKPFPLLPREPLFRLYGYPEEYWRARRMGETEETLKTNFLGVTRQSAWDRTLDFEPRKRVRRAVRMFLKYCLGRW
ncbi:MAG: DUF6492 family protein [Nevskiales bacterium]|nr:DUF6492 family protein [Nevskiales bacterium]